MPYCRPPAMSEVKESPMITQSAGMTAVSRPSFSAANAPSKKARAGLDAPSLSDTKNQSKYRFIPASSSRWSCWSYGPLLATASGYLPWSASSSPMAPSTGIALSYRAARKYFSNTCPSKSIFSARNTLFQRISSSSRNVSVPCSICRQSFPFSRWNTASMYGS